MPGSRLTPARPVTGPPSPEYECFCTAALELQRARYERRRLANVFRSINASRLVEHSARCQASKPRRYRSSVGKRKQTGAHRADTCARASRQVSALFGPRPCRTHQFAASPFRSIAVIAGAAGTSIPLPSEVAKADETVKAGSGRAQIANGKDLVAALLARLEPSLHFRFSPTALGGQRENKIRPRCCAYRPRPAIWPRDFVRPRHQQYGARRCLRRRQSNSPRCFARARHQQ